MTEPTRYVIVNADDFGVCHGVNRGVVDAFDRGIVTSASLMVEKAAALEAAALAAQRPGLSVGLHVILTHESGVPGLDLGDARLVRRKIDAQIGRFTDLMGAAPTHLDSHHNIHRDERVADQFVEAAGRLGVPMREHSVVRYFSDFYGQWDDGSSHPEWIAPTNLLRMVEDFTDRVTELACHPGYDDPSFRSSYRLERSIEMVALLDPTVAGAFDTEHLRLISYHDLGIVV